MSLVIELDPHHYTVQVIFAVGLGQAMTTAAVVLMSSLLLLHCCGACRGAGRASVTPTVTANVAATVMPAVTPTLTATFPQDADNERVKHSAAAATATSGRAGTSALRTTGTPSVSHVYRLSAAHKLHLFKDCSRLTVAAGTPDEEKLCDVCSKRLASHFR